MKIRIRLAAALLLSALLAGLASCAGALPEETSPAGETLPGETGAEDRTAEEKTEEPFDDEGFCGIVLRAPKAVTVILYKGFSGDAVVKPDHVREDKETGMRYRYYGTLVSGGTYHYVSSGASYYTVNKCLLVTAEKKAARTEIDAEPGKKSGDGWEPAPGPVYVLSDEMLEGAVQSDEETWKEYANVLNTPAFAEGKAEHQFTTQDELEKYLGERTDPAKGIYRFALTQSGRYHYELPIVIFTKTDLSSSADWREAAARVSGNGKMTVHIQAQIHGNEPAGGEGALALIGALFSDDAWRNELLGRLNLYIIPRGNPDGARNFTRNEGATDKDMNRLLYTLETPEIRAVVEAFHAFDPYVCVDAHEYKHVNTAGSGNYNDIMMRTGGGVNNGAAVREIGTEFLIGTYTALSGAGLRPSGYPDADNKGGGSTANTGNPVTSVGYLSSTGAISFLVESRGIGDGRTTFRRRVAAQVIALRSVLTQACERAEEVKKVVKAERERLASLAKKYDPDDVFILECRISKDPDTALYWDKPVYDYITGKMTSEGKNSAMYYYDTAVRSRPRATAYLIPKGVAKEEKIRDLLDVHGVRYYEIAPGARVSVLGYTGTTEKAELTGESLVAFENGAIVIPLDQAASNIAAYLCEPDVTDAGSKVTSFAQMKLLSPANGIFPIWRYQKALVSGKVQTN